MIPVVDVRMSRRLSEAVMIPQVTIFGDVNLGVLVGAVLTGGISRSVHVDSGIVAAQKT